MNPAAIIPYAQLSPSRAIPKNERKGVNRGASNPATLVLQAEAGANSNGSQEAK
jgi:hypothetical protein